MPFLVPSGSSHLVVSSDKKSVTGTAGLIYSGLLLTEFDENKITFKIQTTFCDKPITFAGVTQSDPDDFSTNPPPSRMNNLPKTWCVRVDGAKFEPKKRVLGAGKSFAQAVGDIWSIQTTDGQVRIYHNNEERWGSPAFQINQEEDTWAVISLGASSTTITEIIGDAPLHKDIIRKLYFILRNHISGPVIIDMIAFMYAEGTLTKEDMDLCKAQPTDAEKVDKVLDIIVMNPREGYYSFLRAAEVSGKTYLPEILTNKNVVASVNVSVKSESSSSEIQKRVEKLEEELLQKYQQSASEVASLINDLKRKILFLTKGSINFFVLCPDQDSLDDLMQSGEKLKTHFFKALDIGEIRARLQDSSLNVQVKINEYFVTEDKKICAIYDVPEVLHHQLHGHSHEVRALLEGGVSPDTCWPDGVSGLHVAVSTRNIDLAKVLLDFKADVNIRNTRGNTPLHLISCAMEINPEIFTLTKILLDHNANINIQNVTGETPLHLACKIGSVQLAQYLLETKPGIDKSILTKDGLSYISLAHKHNHLDCVKVLKENGFDSNLHQSLPLPIDEEETASENLSEHSSSTIAKGKSVSLPSQIEVGEASGSSLHREVTSETFKHRKDLYSENEEVLEHLGIKEHWKPPFPDAVTEFETNILTIQSKDERKSYKLCQQLLKEIFNQNSDAISTVFQPFSRSMVESGKLLIGSKDESHQHGILAHPQDVLLYALQSVSHIFRLRIFPKLYDCKLAFPLIFPDVTSESLAVLKFALRNVVLRYEGFNESCALKQKAFVIGCIRLSDLQFSKSDTLNRVLSSGNLSVHSTFFTRYSKLGRLKRTISDGSIELAWLLPNMLSNTKEPYVFLNIRGLAYSYELQTEFLFRSAHIMLVFLHFQDLCNQKFYGLYKEFSSQRNECKMILVISMEDIHADMEERIMSEYRKLFSLGEKENGPFHFLVATDTTGHTQSDMHEELLKTINMSVEEYSCSSMLTLEDLFRFLPDHTTSDDSSESVKKCVNGAEKICPFLGTFSKLSEYKNSYFQLHTTFCKIITLEKKLQNELNETERAGLENERKKLRKDQSAILYNTETPSSIHEFIFELQNIFIDTSEKDILMFMDCLKYQFDTIARRVLPNMHKTYNAKWNEYVDCRRQKVSDISILKDLEERVDEATKALTEASLGVENLIRELAQAFEVLKSNSISEIENISFPRVVADLFVQGFPLEIMDGDSNGIPTVWLNAVFDFVWKKLGTRKVLVVSILGVQSSGKSTLLNSMFGVQFAVNAGRCTKGVFAQLVKVETAQSKNIGVDYIMAIDTEGIRAMHNIDDGLDRDNKIATFVIGLSDITLINLKGEDTFHMNDVLQIVAHAFLRMKQNSWDRFQRKCTFAFQNIDAIDADQKLKTTMITLEKALNKAIRDAVELEGKGDISQFRDLIDFDAKDIHFIPSLLGGSPPMAPINRGYRTKVGKLCESLLGSCQRDQPSNIHAIKDKVLSLWTDILSDTFIYPFRNTEAVKLFVISEDERRQVTSSLHEYIHDLCQDEARKSFKKCMTLQDVESTFNEFKQTRDDLIKKKVGELQKEIIETSVNPEMASIFETGVSFFNDTLSYVKKQKCVEIRMTESTRNLALSIKHKLDKKHITEEKAMEEFQNLWSEFGPQIITTPNVLQSIFDELPRFFKAYMINLRNELKNNPLEYPFKKTSSLKNSYTSETLLPYIKFGQKVNKKDKPKYVINGLLKNLEADLKTLNDRDDPFTPNLAMKVVNKIIRGIDAHNKTQSSRFSFRPTLKVKTSVLALRHAIPYFEELNTRKKEQFLNEFKDMIHK